MKSILLISRCPPFPLHFGDRLILWHLTRELSRRGHVIDLLALCSRDDDIRQVERYRKFYRHVELVREPPRGVTAYLRRLLNPGARFATTEGRSFCPQLWRHVTDYLRDHDYDLAHCFGSVSVYEYHPLFADMPNVITPYESHALYLASAAAQGDLGARLRYPLVRRFERFMYRPYDRTVVISPADEAMLQALQPKLETAVIPNGVELTRLKPGDAEREPSTLLFVGNFAYPPNQNAARLLITDILPAVRKAIPAARLQLVGVNPPGWLQSLANDQIEVTGPVPDVAPYLARGTVFLCPLRTGAGLKNKVLEALAMGIPLVATPLSVAGIDVNDGESAMIAELDQFADATIHLLQNEALRLRLAESGPQLVTEKYSWTRAADEYERLYDQICAR